LDYHYAKIACVHAWVGGGQWKPFDHESNTASSLDWVA